MATSWISCNQVRAETNMLVKSSATLNSARDGFRVEAALTAFINFFSTGCVCDLFSSRPSVSVLPNATAGSAIVDSGITLKEVSAIKISNALENIRQKEAICFRMFICESYRTAEICCRITFASWCFCWMTQASALLLRMHPRSSFNGIQPVAMVEDSIVKSVAAVVRLLSSDGLVVTFFLETRFVHFFPDVRFSS